jgi:YesN/AraC family two-component response regulator
MVQLLFYYFLSRKTLNSYQHSIQHIFSETSKIDLQWVRWLITGYLILVITFITLYSLVLLYTSQYSLFLVINAAVITPYIYIATFKGITQPTLWQIQSGVNKEKVEQEILEAEKIESDNFISNEEKPGRQKDFSNDEKLSGIMSGIIKVMEKEKLYQEAQLTLQNLADKLQVQPYQVSQAINNGMNKNFYDLVNGYRVEEAKRLLSDPKCSNFTILSIGFDAGFNSKTTFNTVFKKFTGLTPTEFRTKQMSSVN